MAKQFEEIGEKLPETRDVIRDAAQIIGSLGQPLLELKEILATTPEVFQQQAERQAENDELRATRLLTQTESLAKAVAEAAEKICPGRDHWGIPNQSAESLIGGCLPLGLWQPVSDRLRVAGGVRRLRGKSGCFKRESRRKPGTHSGFH